MVDKYADRAKQAKAEATCKAKLVFESETAASQNMPDHLRPYRCRVCGLWHRTTKKAVKRQRRRAEAEASLTELQRIVARDRKLGERWSPKRRRP